MTTIVNADPEKPHLAIQTGVGEVFGAPPGTTMYLVENATDPKSVVPLILVKVSKKGLVFRCGCMRKGCTRVLKCMKWEGHHAYTPGLGRG